MGVEGIGLEVSPPLIQLVRERLGEQAVMQADFARQPAGFFDVVALINVLEHVRSPSKMLREVVRLVKPGGIALIHVPNLGGLPARLTGRRWHQIEPLAHYYYFDSRTLQNLLRKSGFDPIARFSIVVAGGIGGAFQRWLGRLGIYLDSGLGLVARAGNPPARTVEG
jgi:SAM-dependent methyltransferase